MLGSPSPFEICAFSTSSCSPSEGEGSSGGSCSGTPRVVGFQAPFTPTSVLGDSPQRHEKPLSRASSLTEALKPSAAGPVRLGGGLHIKVTRQRGRLGKAQPGSSAAPAASGEAGQRDAALPAAALPATTQLRDGARRTHPQTASREIPRGLQKAATCPEALDEDLIAAVLQQRGTHTGPPSPRSSSAAASAASTAAGTPAAAGAAPCWGAGQQAQQALQHAQQQALAGTPQRSSWHSLAAAGPGACACADQPAGAGTDAGSPLSRQASESAGAGAAAARRLFDAQADAATARAQVDCLREALLQERERVARLETQLARMSVERELLQQAAVGAAAPPAGAPRALHVQPRAAGGAGRPRRAGGRAAGGGPVPAPARGAEAGKEGASREEASKASDASGGQSGGWGGCGGCGMEAAVASPFYGFSPFTPAAGRGSP